MSETAPLQILHRLSDQEWEAIAAKMDTGSASQFEEDCFYYETANRRAEAMEAEAQFAAAARTGAHAGVMFGRAIVITLIAVGVLALYSGLSGMADGLHMMAGAYR